MALEDDDAIRRLLAGRPRPQLSQDFSRELMRRLRELELARERQRGVGRRLALWGYWLAALVASASILSQGPLPGWMTTSLWSVALVLVPAGYALVLWSGRGALAKHERR